MKSLLRTDLKFKTGFIGLPYEVLRLRNSCGIYVSNKTDTIDDQGNKPIKMLIQNYANLTLDNMVIDGTYINSESGKVRYVVSNNSGNVTIKDTTIKAVDSSSTGKLDFAFDVCKYGSYTAPTVTVSGSSNITGRIEVTGGTLNLENGVTVNGQVRVGEYSATGDTEYTGAKNGVLNIKSGATVNNSGKWAITVFGTNTANIAGNVYGTVGTSGNLWLGGSVINILDGANIVVPADQTGEDNVGIYLASGTLNVSGGTISGPTAVYVKSKVLNITGGTFNGTATSATSYGFYGNGGCATGDALVIDNCNYPCGLDVNNISISGGTFKKTASNAAAVGSYTGNGATAFTEGFIKGGVFNSNPTSLVKTGYSVEANVPSTGWYTVVGKWTDVADTSWFDGSDEFTLTTAEQLAGFAVKVGEVSFKNKTVKLGADIDLSGKIWTAINPREYNTPVTFDGQNHTISNMNATVENSQNGNYYVEQGPAGLFGNVTGWTIKNIIVDHATVKANRQVGGIAGQMICGSISNCTVKNSTIFAENVLTAATEGSGNAAGGIIGYLSAQNSVSATNCTVENCTIEGYRGIGGIAGYYQNPGAVIANCTVTNTVITDDWYTSDKNYKKFDSKPASLSDDASNPKPYVGAFAGWFDGAPAIDSSNTKSNVTLVVKTINE